MGKKRITKILSLLLVMFTAMNITAFAGNTYYAKAIATAVGNGKVYVGVLNTTPSEDLYQTTSENTGPGTSSRGSENADVSFYLFAQPGASNIKFEGWYDNAECTGDALSTDNPYNATINSNVPIQANAVTKNYYAKFVEDNNGPVELEVSLNTAGYATYSCNIATTIKTTGVKAYKAAVDGETITLTELTGNIPAGTGVILYGESAGTQVEFAVATSGEDADVTGNDLKATIKADGTLVTFEANTWALGDGNEFLFYTGSTYIPNRAYLVHEAANANMRIVFADSETTSISNAVSNGASVEGKFLVNGNIVIIKNGTKHNVAGQVVK